MNRFSYGLSRFSLAGLIAISFLTAHSSLAKAPAPKPQGLAWITHYLEDDVISDLSRFYVVTDGDPAKFGSDLRLELRTGDLSHRIARWSSPVGFGAGFGLTFEQRRNIGSLADGTYLLAWTTDKGRCSNVLKFALDSHHEPADEPALRLTLLEPAERGEVGQLLVTACRRTAADPAPSEPQLSFATLIFDGKSFDPTAVFWIGPAAPLKIGETLSRTIALADYELRVDASRAHHIAVRVGSNQTASQIWTSDAPLAEAWDRATAKIADIPPRPISLEGSLIGPDSKPAAKYEIHLRGHGEFKTSSASDGSFAYSNIPAGKYQFICNPPAAGSPSFTIDALELPRPADKPLQLSFAGSFVISGTVTTDKGEPAVGCDIDSSWTSSAGDVEYDGIAKTDEKGRYQIESPLPIAMYIGVGTVGDHPNPYHDVKAPRDALNFQLGNHFGK